VTAQNIAGALGSFLAFVADSRGRKTGILLGVGIFILGTGLVAWKPIFPVFVIAVILIAIAVDVTRPSMHAYLGDQVAYQRRGLVIAVTELAWSTSFIVGVPLMGLLIARWGWTAPFPVLAGLSGLAFLTLTWTVPRDRPPDPAWQGVRGNIRAILASGPALAGLALAAAISGSNEIINLVFGIWIKDSFGLEIAALGAAAVVIGISELGAEGLAGGLVDRMGKERSIRIGLVLNCLSAALFPLLGRQLWGALLALFLFYLTFEYVLVATLPLMTELVPSARGTMLALNAACFSLGRAAGSLTGAQLFQEWGILANAVAAILVNIVALVALRKIKIPVPAASLE
jgi:predicted MFS family arabinose efflux permease